MDNLKIRSTTLNHANSLAVCPTLMFVTSQRNLSVLRTHGKVIISVNVDISFNKIIYTDLIGVVKIIVTCCFVHHSRTAIVDFPSNSHSCSMD
jgi:hypothetical protein